MQTFGHLAAALNDWKKKNNLTIDFNNSRRYFWRIGQPALDAWLPEFEQQVTDATPDEIAAYRKMFDEGGEMAGIPVALKLGNFRGAKLFEMTETVKQFSLNDITTVWEGNVCNQNRNITANGDSLTAVVMLKPGTFRFTNVFDGLDSNISKTTGIIYGKGVQDYRRTTNRNGEESIFGFINYVTGDLQLVRSNTYNDDMILQYEAYCTVPHASSGSGSSSGTSTEKIFPKLKHANITGDFSIFGDPCKEVFSFDLDSNDYFFN